MVSPDDDDKMTEVMVEEVDEYYLKTSVFCPDFQPHALRYLS
jgi:hypothetical protein